jgi:hypothetical protein
MSEKTMINQFVILHYVIPRSVATRNPSVPGLKTGNLDGSGRKDCGLWPDKVDLSTKASGISRLRSK